MIARNFNYRGHKEFTQIIFALCTLKKSLCTLWLDKNFCNFVVKLKKYAAKAAYFSFSIKTKFVLVLQHFFNLFGKFFRIRKHFFFQNQIDRNGR